MSDITTAPRSERRRRALVLYAVSGAGSMVLSVSGLALWVAVAGPPLWLMLIGYIGLSGLLALLWSLRELRRRTGDPSPKRSAR